MICCVCGVLVAPLHDECWRRASTALQMAASCGYGLVAVGRMFALLAGDLLPIATERLYVCVATVLFTACGAVSLTAAATGDSAWGASQPWEAREVARAALALLCAAILAMDGATCHLQALPAPPDREAPSLHLHLHDSPPPYSIAIAEGGSTGALPQ